MQPPRDPICWGFFKIEAARTVVNSTGGDFDLIQNEEIRRGVQGYMFDTLIGVFLRKNGEHIEEV